MASVTKVVCTYDGHKKYSIQVVDESGPVCGGSDTLSKRIRGSGRQDYRVIPMFRFILGESDGSGK